MLMNHIHDLAYISINKNTFAPETYAPAPDTNIVLIMILIKIPLPEIIR